MNRLVDMSIELPPIPSKRYFTIGEVSELCAVKPYVLRYWEQEFSQLRPMKRRGNRRYYQHHEVLLVRRIRELLYEQRFTISGARDRLAERQGGLVLSSDEGLALGETLESPDAMLSAERIGALPPEAAGELRRELLAIRRLLGE